MQLIPDYYNYISNKKNYNEKDNIVRHFCINNKFFLYIIIQYLFYYYYLFKFHFLVLFLFFFSFYRSEILINRN